MNIGYIVCSILTILFLGMGLFFTFFKERAAKFVSGFNSLSKKEQLL